MNENVKVCAICGKPITGFWDTFHFQTGPEYVCTDCLSKSISELEMFLSSSELSSDSEFPDDENGNVIETTATVLDAAVDELII